MKGPHAMTAVARNWLAHPAVAGWVGIGALAIVIASALASAAAVAAT